MNTDQIIMDANERLARMERLLELVERRTRPDVSRHIIHCSSCAYHGNCDYASDTAANDCASYKRVGR